MGPAVIAVIVAAIIVLTAIAKRLNVAYPIVLVIGGIVIGYIPGLPAAQMPPDLVLLVFLPPLLYWESVTAPTSDFRSGAWWIFQLAFGLVIATTVAVAAVAHWIDPALGWAAAFVLGAIVSSTDEVAFSALAEQLRVPRHLVATIEGESLINDATSLIIYAVAISALIGQSFSLQKAAVELVISVLAAVAIGVVAGALVAIAWRITRDDELQPLISMMAPFLAYLPAHYFGVSAVLATVAAGLFINRYSPRELTPRARQRATGFYVTIVFAINAFIFVLVGMQFRRIVESLSMYSPATLIFYAVAISATVIVVRSVWVFAQALLPATNLPEHRSGSAEWSHVAVLAWTGMRGGVSLAAAIAIPLETSAGPFAQRSLIIFLTFAVLLATLVGQGGSLPWLLRALRVRDDGTDDREERLALARTAKAALKKLAEIEKTRDLPRPIALELERRFRWRWREFGSNGSSNAPANASAPSLFRSIERELLDAERAEVIRMRDRGEIDNTVMRRIQALLDFEDAEIELLSTTGHVDLDPQE